MVRLTDQLHVLFLGEVPRLSERRRRAYKSGPGLRQVERAPGLKLRSRDQVIDPSSDLSPRG
jgi:hypothetical protein